MSNKPKPTITITIGRALDALPFMISAEPGQQVSVSGGHFSGQWTKLPEGMWAHENGSLFAGPEVILHEATGVTVNTTPSRTRTEIPKKQ